MGIQLPPVQRRIFATWHHQRSPERPFLDTRQHPRHSASPRPRWYLSHPTALLFAGPRSNTLPCSQRPRFTTTLGTTPLLELPVVSISTALSFPSPILVTVISSL